MLADSDQGGSEWRKFLLDIGDDRIPHISGVSPMSIRLPTEICAPEIWSISQLAQFVYPCMDQNVAQLMHGLYDDDTLKYFCEHAILAPRNEDVDAANAHILNG